VSQLRGDMSRHGLGRLATLIFCILVAGCGDQVVLRDGPDGISLRYDCGDVRSQAASSSEKALVREYALRLVRAADSQSRMNEVEDLFATEKSGDWAEFEDLVVRQVCNDRAILDAVAPGKLAAPKHAGLEIHGVAPEFSLPVLSLALFEGVPDTITLSAMRGSYVLLAFWATWCAPCLVEHPELSAILERLGSRGVSVLGVLHEDSPRRALDWIASREYPAYPTVVDEGDVARAYGVEGLPETILIDPDGRVLDVFFGWFPGKGEDLFARLDMVLPEVPRP